MGPCMGHMQPIAHAASQPEEKERAIALCLGAGFCICMLIEGLIDIVKFGYGVWNAFIIILHISHRFLCFSEPPCPWATRAGRQKRR